jgi:hypothetical protein
MNGTDFERLVLKVFSPFLTELGFRAETQHISGRYYRANYVGEQHTLSISFEPGDDMLTVMLMTNGADDLASIDDRSKTPRLSDLNARYMSNVSASDRANNEAFFAGIEPHDTNEYAIVKAAKELRLVLPHHLGK